MKTMNLEGMENVNGGWSLVCDIDWGFALSWGDSFYGYFAVSNCKFYN